MSSSAYPIARSSAVRDRKSYRLNCRGVGIAGDPISQVNVSAECKPMCCTGT